MSKTKARVSGPRRRSSDGEMEGAYVGHVRGFGFFVPHGEGKDLFVPPGREGMAVDGDTVLVRPLAGDAAAVVRVLERGRKLLSGTCVAPGRVIPDAHRIPKTLRVEGKAAKGDKVLVAATPERFVIRRVLGRAGSPEVEDAAVLAELDISPDFPQEVLRAASRLTAPAPPRERLDLRDRCTVVTIDPQTSRDFDDAVSVERLNDGWLLGVHIADVAHFVRPGDPIDREARRRGTSVYLPNRVIPMLPEKLSNDLCSLREGVDRLTLSVLLHYDREGRLLETTFAESLIRSDRRYSYERASRIMEGRAAGGGRGPAAAMLRNMVGLARLLKRRRRSLEIDREEIELVYNAAGDVVDIHSTAEDAAHGVIEEFMLAANQAVAQLMLERRVRTLFRHHPAPADLEPVWETLRLLGIEGARRMGLRRALAKANRAGFGPTVSAALFRCMPRALYTSGAASHFSLGFEAYLHFTSPIRRYPDLVLHRHLHALLQRAGGRITKPATPEIAAPIPDETLEELARHVNARAFAAERAESRLRRRRVLEFLLRLGGVPTEGQVTTVVERGLVIDLPEYGASGFLAVELLPGGPYAYQPGCLTGKKRSYRLGETLEVRIHRIDPASGQLDLAPVQG